MKTYIFRVGKTHMITIASSYHTAIYRVACKLEYNDNKTLIYNDIQLEEVHTKKIIDVNNNKIDVWCEEVYKWRNGKYEIRNRNG